MKKLLLGSCLLMAAFSFGQQIGNVPDMPFVKSKQIVAPPAQSAEKALPFWSETFGSGIPSSWAVVDSSTICPWVYSMDGSWGNFNGNGATAGGTPINSTTANDGFIICDPDSANHFTYGQPSGSTYQYLSSYIITSGIDCSGRSSVILNFEQYFRYNNGVSMNVMVSNDSINWTTFNVSGGMANNAASPNADLVSLNITNIAANQPKVYLKIGWSARVYYWMIDDISLREADPYDAMIGDSWWGSGQFKNQYYKIPLVQNSPVTFYSEVLNNTGTQLNNVYSDVTVTNTGGIDFQGNSAQMNLVAVEMDTFTVSTVWTPSVPGMHYVDFSCNVSGQTDGNPLNNDFSDSLQITNSLYGLDNLSSPTQSTGSISNFSSNIGGEFRIGNIYEIINDDGIQCVEIGIANTAQNDGKSIYAEVHAWDTLNSEWVLRGQSDVYDILTADLGSIISLPLFLEAPVYAGEEVLVLAGHYGGAVGGTDDVSFMYGQPVADGMVYGFNAAGDAFWLSNPRAIVCRAQFDCGLGVDELSNSLKMEVYPNPANDELIVELVPTSNETKVELVDMNGKVVLTETHSVFAGQSSKLFINTALLQEGVYTLVVQTEQTLVQERVVLMH